ncbi:MAG: 16S rRNA (cytosine(1402)-N(4))-methyltransferase RsmH [Anaerolineae bacterium]|nr:16S rRNA (cytosine(1402)-N(4))-methyltransferase RsmH [Anaerolineae bacterium]
MIEPHVPVLYAEILAHLDPQPGSLYIDATLGAGGHTAGLLEAGALVLGLDADADTLAVARERLARFDRQATFVHANFAAVAEVAPAHGFAAVDGVLFDLGLSSLDVDEAGRGFSFRREGPLDMRFDRSQGPTAADLVNTLTADALADILYEYGEEPRARAIARRIVERRPLQTTTELASVIEAVTPRKKGKGGIHPATRTFQALRVAVNDELSALEKGLGAAIGLLKPGGVLAVISFHSLEDRLVKQMFKRESTGCICPPRQPVCTCDHRAVLELVTRKPVVPGAAEVVRNPRSRSARLRVALKL